MLYRWLSINSIYSENIFGKAIGLTTINSRTLEKVIEKLYLHVKVFLF